jgi:IPT/TIG domain
VNEKTVIFPRPRGPHDYLKMRGKALKYLMLGTILVGQLTLGLWYKQERLVGAQRQYTYVEKIEKGKKYLEILAVNVYFTASGTYGRDSYLPGWNPSANTVDCIGGGGGGALGAFAGAGGGGGGGLARYTNVGALPATFSLSVGGGGGQGGAGGNTQLDGWVGAYGGGAGGVPGGGAGGTYYAGTGYFPGGAGGAGDGVEGGGGGGGGAGGRYGAGSAGGKGGAPAYGGAMGVGGNGGPSGGGAGAGGQGQTGANGNEWQANVGSGGGGSGGYYSPTGGHGGYYGGGGAGGYQMAGNAGGSGRQGLIAIVYTPLTAPVVSTCTPNRGSTLGGTAITIGGSGFVNVVGVSVGGTAATSVSVPNTTTITCVTPAHAAGLVSLTVSVSGGVAAGTGTNLFTYVLPAGGFNMPMLGI